MGGIGKCADTRAALTASDGAGDPREACHPDAPTQAGFSQVVERPGRLLVWEVEGPEWVWSEALPCYRS